MAIRKSVCVVDSCNIRLCAVKLLLWGLEVFSMMQLKWFVSMMLIVCAPIFYGRSKISLCG
jgi:endonuclease/exonuclease/phosphatase (EEP) superfamily protein YafD